MILLNTTFVIPVSEETAFLNWVSQHYFPTIFRKGHAEPKLLAIPAPDELSKAFGVQFTVADKKEAAMWRDNILPLTITKLTTAAPDTILHFTTLMDILQINEQ
ncbi:MAG: DUF4286 family protein [Firmicutes bacterium]|nr:DUF4286 family protein [Bacillota bacterium]MCM1477707.1 DUF4286 family protein [Bacteroides sp.]